jgi:hypothetical protein
MSFRKPEEDDDGQTFEEDSTGGGSGSGSGSITEETVRFGDEEVTVADAIQLAGDMLTEPEAFGIAKTERVRELEDMNQRLREKNNRLRQQLDELRSDVATLWMVQSEIDNQGRYVLKDGNAAFLPDSFSSSNPGGEIDNE